MKNFAVVAAIAMMSFTTIMEGAQNVKKRSLHNQLAHKHHSNSSSSSSSSSCSSSSSSKSSHKAPSGSFYADSTSQSPLQAVVLAGITPLTVPVHFSGTNVKRHDVTLSSSGNSITVAKKGIYKIEWNASLSSLQSPYVHYHFDLQKNKKTLLHPIPQVIGEIGNGIYATPTNSAAASVLVPLECDDKISLLVTIDGSEGDNIGDGFQIDSAQISLSWVSPLHK